MATIQNSLCNAPDRPVTAGSAVALLRRFYSQAGAPPPLIESIAADALPEVARSLLAHDSDMTSTLEQFYKAAIHIRVLRRERLHSLYLREVVLVTENGLPVEYGVIKIDLNRFPGEARQLILAERLPLGRILQEMQIPYLSRPQTFYAISPNRYIAEQLGLESCPKLYGRRNLLLNPERKLLADVLEILAPAQAGEFFEI